MFPILSHNRVLITGGAGFIGANLARKLLKENFTVHILRREGTNMWRLEKILPLLNLYTVDLLNKNQLKKIIEKIKPSVIIHLATYSDYRNQNEWEQMLNVNIRGTLNLLKACASINYDLFINTGSSSEYGSKDKPMKEKDLLEPISFYAAGKACATLLCQVFAREFKKPIVTLRPFSVYGPNEEENRFIPTIVKAVIEKKSIKLTSGNQRRDFIYIDDVTDIYLKAIRNAKKISGEILNMGTGIEYTNDEVVNTLFKVACRQVPVKKGAFPKRLWDTPHWVADIQKTGKMLNWKPKYSLEVGLKKTYESYKNG